MESATNDFGFYYLGKGNLFVSGEISVKNPHRIYIGNSCVISKNVEMTVNDFSNMFIDYNLKFGDNSFINSSSKIEAKNYIEIGKNVSIGPHVYISDMEHKYEDFRVPIKLQEIKEKANKVIIKEGSWIGSGAKIIGNIKIGYGCIVGANSVVKSDIPDHCVVVGAPAKIIKVCDYRTGQWIKLGSTTEELNELLINRGSFLGYNYYKLQNRKKSSNKKESNKLNNMNSNQNMLIDLSMLKFESIMNDLYEAVILAYEDNIDVAFENIIRASSEVESLFSELIKNSSDKDVYEHNLIRFNECLKLLLGAYENRNVESFIRILENQLIVLIKDAILELNKYN